MNFDGVTTLITLLGCGHLVVTPVCWIAPEVVLELRLRAANDG